MTFVMMAMIVVAGSPDDETIWRGWPVHVQAGTDLKVTGPSELTPQRGRTGWVLKPVTSAQLATGQYQFAAGEEQFSVTVADPPATLSPAQVARRQQIEMWCAAELGDVAAAERLAAAQPKSPTALAALGEARYATGDVAGAFKAYQQAIQLSPPGREAPRALLRRATELLQQLIVTAPAVAPVAAEPPPTAVDSETPTKPELGEAVLLADKAGQWAIAAEAGSQYGSGAQYSPKQATGAPDVPQADDHGNAWCPSRRTGGTEWLELTYERPVIPQEVRVRQSYGAVGIIKIEGVEPDGTRHVLWEGRDPDAAEQVREIKWFVVRAGKLDKPVNKLRLTINLDAHSGWKQIDAVQLVGRPQP
jgi:tetratricopeptide (TPR) repeat protein